MISVFSLFRSRAALPKPEYVSTLAAAMKEAGVESVKLEGFEIKVNLNHRTQVEALAEAGEVLKKILEPQPQYSQEEAMFWSAPGMGNEIQ